MLTFFWNISYVDDHRSPTQSISILFNIFMYLVNLSFLKMYNKFKNCKLNFSGLNIIFFFEFEYYTRPFMLSNFHFTMSNMFRRSDLIMYIVLEYKPIFCYGTWRHFLSFSVVWCFFQVLIFIYLKGKKLFYRKVPKLGKMFTL